MADDTVIGLELPVEKHDVLSSGLREVVARCRDAPALEIEPE